MTRKTGSGLQVQRLTLTARGRPDFTLFPMIHVADKGFFDRVMNEADAHDCVLKEGVGWRPVARTTRRAYKAISRGSPDLAVQPSGPEGSRKKWYNSDLDPETFRQSWKKIPLVRRIFFHVALRVIGLILRFGKARVLLSEALASSTIRDGDAMEAIFGKEFRQVVLDDRDAALLRGCEIAIERRPDDRVAIVWGAAHLPPLVTALMEKHGYRISNREWITAVAAG
ncbi:hypothetical protein AAFO92_02060 [Roseovarius sp. CAU 1744]|uniref:hypothetical protein n=1 Tax=Roseovarius sp. CAU 1744 TaxID=3140368 RepID=UPI00325BC6DC